MDLCPSYPKLAGASQANVAMLGWLRAYFRVFYLGLKLIRGLLVGLGLNQLGVSKRVFIRHSIKGFLSDSATYCSIY